MEGRSEVEAMAELAQQMWDRFFKGKVVKDLLAHSLDGYKAMVYANNGDGTLTVVRPFDNQRQTMRCPPALAQTAESGDQVLVVQLGDASNSFILCGADLSGLGDGGGGGRYRPVSFDFSTINDESYYTETVEGPDSEEVSTAYAVTRDQYGRIVTVVNQTDGWQTTVEWGEPYDSAWDEFKDRVDDGSASGSAEFAVGEQIAAQWEPAEGSSYSSPWDIVHYDDAGNAYLQWHYAQGAMAFDEAEALYVFDGTEQAGVEYYLLINKRTASGNAGFVTGDGIAFTLSAAPAAGDQLVLALNHSHATNPVNSVTWNVYGAGETTSKQTGTTRNSTGGTKLGETSSVSTFQTNGRVNAPMRAIYGYGRWSQSAIRQWLNSSAPAGEWWSPQNIWDRPPAYAQTHRGFMAGLPSEMLSVVQRAEVITALAADEDPTETSDITQDYFWLPSLEEIYAEPAYAVAEGEAWDYYKNLAEEAGLSGRFQWSVNYSQLIKYTSNSTQTAAQVFLRSILFGAVQAAIEVFKISDSGGITQTSVWPIYYVSPACKIARSGGGGGGGAAEGIIATVEASATASKSYAVKDYLILSKVLYRVTSPISAGDTIANGTNVTVAVLGDDVAVHIRNTSNPHQVTAAQVGAMPDDATLDDISNGTTYAKTTAAQAAQIGTNQASISAIEGKIPSAASTSNQLADKAFVTDSITQGTAIFRGSFATKAALLAVAWQTTDPNAPYYVSNNDYAVVLDDETQSDECWRYIYVTGTGWTPQYRINETPMTQAQLDALNSGATAAIISSVADKLDKTGDGKDVTATFTAASTRANISTGEKLSVLFGKIAKWFTDLGTAAFRAATGSITSGSTDLVESGAVYTGLAGKQAKITANGILKGDGAGGVSAATPGTDYQVPLTIDATPTASSTNPVQSGGVYTDVRTRVPVYGMGKNLLDNWYFISPVNQRGLSSYSGSVYNIDRWHNSGNGTITVQNGLTIVSGGLRQWVSKSRIIDGETYTISFLTEYGLKSATGVLSESATGWQFGTDSINGWLAIGQYSSGRYDLRLTGTQRNIAVKLELGTQQTLCHNEGTDANPVWVLNEIPDYEEELIKCQTSTADPSDTFANKSLATEQQLAYVETGTTASRAYAVGEYFCWNGLLYRATTAISSGASFTVGTNCESVTGGGFNHLFSRVNHITPSFYVSSRKSSNGSTTTTFTTNSTIAGTYGYVLILGEKSDASAILTLAIVHNGGIPVAGKKNLGNYSIDVALSGNTLTITATDNWCNYYIMSTYNWV